MCLSGSLYLQSLCENNPDTRENQISSGKGTEASRRLLSSSASAATFPDELEEIKTSECPRVDEECQQFLSSLFLQGLTMLCASHSLNILPSEGQWGRAFDLCAPGPVFSTGTASP